MNECRHGLNEDWCASCKKQLPPAPLVLEGQTISARFGSKCPGCGDPIMVGEDVHLTDAGWACTSCARRAVSA